MRAPPPKPSATIACGDALVLIHPHVERSTVRRVQTAGHFVELRAADAEVDRPAVELPRLKHLRSKSLAWRSPLGRSL